MLEFSASIFSDKDLFLLFGQIHGRMSSCCGFNEQKIPKIEQIKQMDPLVGFSHELMQGFDFSQLKSKDMKKNKVRDSCVLDISERAEPV